MMEQFKTIPDLLDKEFSKPTDVVHKFKNYSEQVPEGKIRLYHQTTLPKLKEILKTNKIKGDVWGQENTEGWRYGDYAIAYDVDPSKIHRANDTDRIIYGDVPVEAFSHIKAKLARTPKGLESFRKELEDGSI